MKANRAAGIGIALTVWIYVAMGLRDGWHGAAVPPAKFAVSPVSLTASNAAPFLHEEFIDPQPKENSAHVSSVCELSEGGLAAAWYAGTREGARDVAIYFATRPSGTNGGWSHPQQVVTRESAAAETFRYVKKVGNPMLFSAGDGRIYLLYVSVGIGGWSASSLNLKHTDDGGRTWAPSRRLGLSPFFNVSELVKNGPVPLGGGGWVVPIYHELLGKFPELLWLRPHHDSGMEVVKTRAFGGRQAFQAALTPLDEQQALLFCRTANAERRIQVAKTSDGGRHWTAPQPIELPNSDSGLDALRLADGRFLLAFNDTASGRHILRLAVSADQAATWRRAGNIAEEAGAEFSYPFLLQTSDGLVHLTYTWKRRGIKHVTCNLAWLGAQAGKNSPASENSRLAPLDLIGAPSPAPANWNTNAETRQDDARHSGSSAVAPMNSSLPAILVSFAAPALILLLLFQALARRLRRRAQGWTWFAGLTAIAVGVVVLPLQGLPLARWVAGVVDHWSIPLLALLVANVAQKFFSVELLRPADEQAAGVFGALAGVTLYPLALGLGPVDPYSFGWHFGPLFVGVGVGAVILLWRRNRFGIVLFMAVLAWGLRVPESGNYWDCLVDPFYFLAALGGLGSKLWRKLLPQLPPPSSASI